MEGISSRGIILNSREYKDKDRLVSVLTKDYGLITVCAKGCGKQGSKNAFMSIPFMVIDLVCSVSHGYYYLKDGSIVENNRGIMYSLEALATASHFAECLMDSSLQSENFKEAYELAAYAFYSLSQDPKRFKTLYSAFNWRLLAIVGFTIIYDDVSPDKRYRLSISGGDIRPDASGISGRSVKALNHFATCSLKELFAVKLDPEMEEELKTFTRDYLCCQFDREYNALSVLDALPRSSSDQDKV